MSLVPPGTPPRAPARNSNNMCHSTGRRYLISWRTNVQLLLCFAMLVGFNLCLHSYYNSRAVDHSLTTSDSHTNSLFPHKAALTKSPLQELFRSDASFDYLSEEEIAIISDIESKAALDVKFFAIPETVYSLDENELLRSYVEQQLKSASDVLTERQGEFVLKLIESGVAQGSMMKKELGDKGSLRNSIVIAFMRGQGGNLHFAMAGVSVEPRLGWRLITKKQRNEWNEVLSRLADTRLKQELGNLFAIHNQRAIGEGEVDEYIALD